MPSCAGLCQYQVGLHQLPTCRRVSKALWTLRRDVGWWFSREPSIMRPWVCSSLFLWPEGSTRTFLSQTTWMFKPSALPPYMPQPLQLAPFMDLHFPIAPGNNLLPAVLHTCPVWYSLLICLQLDIGLSLTLFHYVVLIGRKVPYMSNHSPILHIKIVRMSQLILFGGCLEHLSEYLLVFTVQEEDVR